MNVDRIRALCKEHGTNLKQLEIALGFGNGTIARWPEQVPAVTRVKAVADYFGTTVDELLKDDGRPMTAPTEDVDMVARSQGH